MDMELVVICITNNFNALVAQLYRAIRFYRKGWGLESLRVRQFIILDSTVNSGTFSHIFLGEQKIANGNIKKYVVKIVNIL